MEKLKRLELARNTTRITGMNFLKSITNDFIEFHGDRCYGDDRAVITGIAKMNDMYITAIVQEKGVELEGKIEHNFGMSNPEGYRKTLRMIKQAEKFKRPILMIIDTAGAYPGIESEERGQASAIANMLYTLSDIKVPVISIVLSEGGSGGALALGVADYIYSLENAYYSVISPEGYAEILYKGKKEVKDIIDDLPIFSEDLLKLFVVDEVLKEPEGGIVHPLSDTYKYSIKDTIYKRFDTLKEYKEEELVKKRYERFRKFGK